MAKINSKFKSQGKEDLKEDLKKKMKIRKEQREIKKKLENTFFMKWRVTFSRNESQEMLPNQKILDTFDRILLLYYFFFGV